MRSTAHWLIGLVPLAAGLLIWELVTTDDNFSFPQPSSWWTAGQGLWESGALWPALKATMTTYLVSMLIASVIGVTAGIVLGFVPWLERTFTPLIDFFRTLPPPVIVPVLTLLLGITLKAGVAIVVLSVVWPILLNTIGAVHEMSVTRREVSRVLGLGWVESLVKVTLPSLLPGIIVGLRTALSIGLVVTLLADILGSADGIGRLLVYQQQTLASSAVWALLFLIGVLGYTLNLAVQGGAALLLRRHPAARS
jgi:NitT/TauT family transport system permease protein